MTIYRAVYIFTFFFVIYLVTTFPPAVILPTSYVFSVSAHALLLRKFIIIKL